LVPLFGLLLLEDTTATDLAAAAVFGIAAVTDIADGYLARRRGDVTDFGKLADPLADKLLVAMALVALVVLDRLWAWAAVVMILREVLVTAARTWASRRGAVAPAQPLGKAKTGAQIVMVLVLVLAGGDPWWADLVIWVAVTLTVLSGLDFARALHGQLARASRGT
jgi:CDP-diacylglycerol---glycerol-3-phosphate 3-phosphatidyltransferase